MSNRLKPETKHAAKRQSPHWVARIAVCLLTPSLLEWYTSDIRSLSLEGVMLNDSRLLRPLSWLWSTPKTGLPTYTRIRIQEQKDFTRLYDLIIDFHQHPEHADTVQEVVFRAPVRRERYLTCTTRPDAWKARENTRDTSGEKQMYDAIQILGLGQKEQDEWVKILTWMEPSYRSERETALRDDERSFEIEPYFRNRDSLFAQYATALLMMLCPNIHILVYEENHYRNPDNPVFNSLRRNNYDVLPQRHLQR